VGDSVSISVVSGDFDSLLSLFGPSGEYLTCDDDSGADANAILDGYTLPSSGMYYIDVLSYGKGANGAYSLTLVQTSAGAIPSSINTAAISYGSTVDQTLGAWVGDEWMFSGTAGDVVTISMTSADFDTFLDLYGPTLLRVAMDDDGGGDTNSEISSAVLPATGIYTIVARSFAPGGAGNYALSILANP
jgi:serine protease Do